jgi:hypothetical protein
MEVFAKTSSDNRTLSDNFVHIHAYRCSAGIAHAVASPEIEEK